MINYLYDGSFEGLLTAVFEAYYNERKPDNIVPLKNYYENFLYENVMIATDEEKFKRVYAAIQKKISDRALENVYYTFLSELDGFSNFVFEYLRFGFRTGRDIDAYLTDTSVMNVHRAVLKVTGERHRLLGLLRFKKLRNNIYYASIEPDHNVLPILAPHFAERMADQCWVIHDIKRGLAAVYDTHRWSIEVIYSKPGDIWNSSCLKDSDADFEELWKLYFRHIAIESRKNLNLQKQHMPKRYWKHLTEKNF